ncbi:MAG: hypothetical protein NTX61_07290 [Bacteroidetes bacterium]|nr:hypothetical protein [Bacteroidota bacterium]
MLTNRHPDPWPCPRCGSFNCGLVKVNKFSGTGAVKGALAGVIFGPLAIPGMILGGLAGSKKGFSQCNDCGYYWEISDWRFT